MTRIDPSSQPNPLRPNPALNRPVAVQAVASQPPAQPAAAAQPGLIARTRDAWKHAWAPSWAGVPNWVHNIWESSGKVSAKLHTKLGGNAVGRAIRSGLGSGMATLWRVVDFAAGLRKLPKPPTTLPTEALAAPLPRAASALPWLSTRGNKIVNEAGQAVRLRGVNLSGFEYTQTGGTATSLNLAAIKHMGGNVLRLPLNQGLALSDPAYLARVDQTIAEAALNGIYTVVDMHWIAKNQTALPDAETARMWRQLANRWSQQPNVLYDLQNEPGMVGWDAQAAWSEHLIAAIRSVNPKALVMVEGTNKAQRVAGALDRPIRAENVVYQVHAYGPRQHGPGVGPSQWESLFGKVADKYPVFVGEFGGEKDELPAMKELLAWLDQRGLGWAVWHSRPGEVIEANGTLAPLGQLAAESLRRP